MALTEDRSNTKRALAHHVSGEEYLVVSCSLWDGDQPAGTRIIGAAGPISRRDLLPDYDGGPLEPSSALFDAIDRLCDDGDLVNGQEGADAAWLQAEEDAGRISYPVGVR